MSPLWTVGKINVQNYDENSIKLLVRNNIRAYKQKSPKWDLGLFCTFYDFFILGQQELQLI